MGWTGMFNWDRSETNQQILERELFGYGEKNYEPMKWSQKGSHVWCLYRHKETGRVSAMVVLCDRKKNDPEFCYKEVGLSSGPCELDMPKGWLNLIDKSYFTDEYPYAKDWIERFNSQTKTKKTSYNFGDIIKCHTKEGIEWGNSYKIPKDSDFYVRVDVLNPFVKRQTKMYRIVRKNDNGMFFGLNYRLGGKTFDSLEKELVK